MTAETDYASEMRAIIDEATSHGPYSPRQIAAEVVEKLRANDPELLDGWLHTQAEHFVWQAINDRDRSRRSHVAHTARRGLFRQATERHDDGDSAPLAQFLQLPYTVEDGTRLELGQMRKPDLLFVADDYARRSRENAMWEAFMRALAKKVGTRTVADHYTDEQLSAMFQSLQG